MISLGKTLLPPGTRNSGSRARIGAGPCSRSPGPAGALLVRGPPFAHPLLCCAAPRSAVHGYRRVCPARCGRPAIWPGGPARRARRSVRP